MESTSEFVGAYVVTGGSKGIGYEIVRGLAKARPSALVLFTGRDREAGLQAEEALKQEGHHSVSFICTDSGAPDCGVEILSRIPDNVKIFGIMNNAAINSSDPNSIGETIEVNVMGPKRLVDILSPRMANGSKIVNMVNNNSILDGAVDVARNLLIQEGYSALDAACIHCETNLSEWQTKPYTASKLLLAALTRAQRADLRLQERGVSTVCCDPGWCRTNMTMYKPAPLSAEEGADTPIWLLLSEANESGIYYQRVCYGWDKAYR